MMNTAIRIHLLAVILFVGLGDIAISQDMPTQVEVELQFIDYNKQDIDELSRNSGINIDGLMTLHKQGRSHIVAQPRLITKAGDEASIKTVKEFIYPTEYKLNGAYTNSVSDLTGVQSNAISAVIPDAFETREVGAILTVLPEVREEGDIITLTMTPQIVTGPQMMNYETTLFQSTGEKINYEIPQPIFYTTEIQTRIAMRYGETVLIGGGSQNKDNDMIRYIFVTARLMGLDGKPLEK